MFILDEQQVRWQLDQQILFLSFAAERAEETHFVAGKILSFTKICFS